MLKEVAAEVKIIDIHTHIYPEKIAGKAVNSLQSFYHLLAEGKGTAKDLKAAMLPEMRAVLLPVATRPETESSINGFVASVAAEDNSFIGFGTVHPQNKSFENEIENILKLNLKGVKFHADMQNTPIDSPIMYPIYQSLEGKLPVILHCGDFRSNLSHPKRVAKIVKDFPHLTVIAAHFGGWSVYDAAYEALKNVNCFVDTSSSVMFMPREKIIKLMNGYGRERLIFGSDYPMCKPSEEAERLLSFGMDYDFYERVMYKNAAELLNIE